MHCPVNLWTLIAFAEVKELSQCSLSHYCDSLFPTISAPKSCVNIACMHPGSLRSSDVSSHNPGGPVRAPVLRPNYVTVESAAAGHRSSSATSERSSRARMAAGRRCCPLATATATPSSSTARTPGYARGDGATFPSRGSTLWERRRW